MNSKILTLLPPHVFQTYCFVLCRHMRVYGISGLYTLEQRGPICKEQVLLIFIICFFCCCCCCFSFTAREKIWKSLLKRICLTGAIEWAEENTNELSSILRRRGKKKKKSRANLGFIFFVNAKAPLPELSYSISQGQKTKKKKRQPEREGY